MTSDKPLLSEDVSTCNWAFPEQDQYNKWLHIQIQTQDQVQSVQGLKTKRAYFNCLHA